ncbi:MULTISPECIES: hypothetical protein [Pseudomonas]|uniref:Uncharacterized protein n=1 Tax=Pseudomonas fluorescens TaxID=294 RepID=A0A166MTN4_PSEFL|nr:MULTISPECIES: hypothetical protein [Pseudomonas]KZN16199.1 hypothetical protein A1D17_08530 [Pseudomonas fluorescens]
MTTRPKTGGRKRGSIDREERKVLTDKMAGDLMWCYQRLGGRDWLLKFAQDKPEEFLRQGLSRLFPAPQKDDEPSGTYNTQINVNNMTAVEAGMRVAYALNLGIQAQRELAPVAERVPEQPVDISPQEALGNWQPTPEPLLRPEPVEDPAKTLWIEELPLTAEQRRDNAVVRQTHGGSLESYAGSPGEQGGTVQRGASSRKPTVNELHQRMRSRRDELL